VVTSNASVARRLRQSFIRRRNQQLLKQLCQIGGEISQRDDESRGRRRIMTNYRHRRRTTGPARRWPSQRRRRPYQDARAAAFQRLICYLLVRHRPDMLSATTTTQDDRQTDRPGTQIQTADTPKLAPSCASILWRARIHYAFIITFYFPFYSSCAISQTSLPATNFCQTMTDFQNFSGIMISKI